MSGLMSAVLGHLLDAEFIQPAIIEIAVASDGFVIGSVEGESKAVFIGGYADLLRNWLGLLDAARLTTAERIEAEALFAGKIGYYVGGGNEN
jgi:hypothetical protein